MKTYDFTVDQFNDARISSVGDYLRYMSSSFQTGNDIRVKGDFLDVVLLPGQAVRAPRELENWTITPGPNNTGVTLTSMTGTVVIGAGNVDDNAAPPNTFVLTSEGSTLVDGGLVWVDELNFALGGWITSPVLKRFYRAAAFSHDGASTAYVDIYLTTATGTAGFINNRIALNSTGLDQNATGWRQQSTPPAQKVFLERVSIPAKGGVKTEWFFPPRGQLYFKPTVQGADTLGQINMGLTWFQP